MKTNVYIDGLNLYYRAVQGTQYKWLDIDALLKKMFPRNTMCKIKYFTSLVSSRPNDPGKPIRQQIYLRALRTFPNIEIIEGHFLTRKVRMPLVTPSPKGSKTVEVWKTEEKGSDVNLAVHLLNDAHNKDYEVAIVVSNDSDLGEALRIVTKDINLEVGVVFPAGAIDTYTGTRYKLRKSQMLLKYASFIREIRLGVLSCSQLPNTMTDANGTFRRPPEWQ